MTHHTILLIQRTASNSTRTYADFETVADAIEEVIHMFETKLKQLNPHQERINYDISDLNAYLDGLKEICALVFAPDQKAYAPHDREWIKLRVYQHLVKVAEQAQAQAKQQQQQQQQQQRPQTAGRRGNRR